MLLSGSIGWAVNSLWLYEYGFQKYDVGRVTGLADAEMEKAARGLISYFNSGTEPLSVTVQKDGQPFTLFNEREVAHMKDVKVLFRIDYKIFFGTLMYALVFSGFFLFRNRVENLRRLAKLTLAGSGVTLGIMLALWIGSQINFEQLFWQFHLLSFANDFWQLNPATDYLIMLFPEGFWYDATLFIALGAAGSAVILGGLALGHLAFNKKKG